MTNYPCFAIFLSSFSSVYCDALFFIRFPLLDLVTSLIYIVYSRLPVVLYRAVSFPATTLDRFIALFHWLFPAAPRYVFT